MQIDANGNPSHIQTQRGLRPNPQYNPNAVNRQQGQDTGLSSLLKDLGSNSTSSDSITLTSGKDDGAIDVTRKDTINAASPTPENTFQGVEQAKVYMPGQEQMSMLNQQYGDDFAKDDVLQNLNGSMMYNSPHNTYQPAPEMITMYHPSGSTIQVNPNEVPLFESNGYSTKQSTPPVGPPKTTANTNQSTNQGTNQGPQTYTVPMDSEDDFALQNDASFDETVNDDGTVTYTSNDAFSGSHSAPGTGNPLGPQETETIEPFTPGYSGGPMQNPSAAVINPVTGKVEATPVDLTNTPISKIAKPVVPEKTTMDNGAPLLTDLQIDTKSKQAGYMIDKFGNPILDANGNKIGYTDGAAKGTGHTVETTNYGAPVLNPTQMETRSKEKGFMVDKFGNPILDENNAYIPYGQKGNFAVPDGQTTGVNGNEKFIQDDTGAWKTNPAYTINEEDESTSDGVGQMADDSGLTEEEIEANFQAEFDRASEENDNQDAEIAAELKAEIDDAAETGDKGLMDTILDGAKGLFKDGELAKALLLYAGSRIAGFSHSGSAKFAYEATDILGSDKSEYEIASDQIDQGVEDGIITPEEAQRKKKSLLIGNKDARDFSANPQTMLDENGKLATRDKKGNWWYRDGTSVPHNIKLRPQPSANNLITLTKPQRERIADNDKTIAANNTALSILEETDTSNFTSGLFGKGLGWMRKQMGMENDQDFANMFTTNASNATALRNRAPGAMTEKEWDILLGATPDKFSDPAYVKKYFQVNTKAMKLENERLSLINTYLDYGLTHSEARAKADADMNKKYPPRTSPSSDGTTTGGSSQKTGTFTPKY